MIDLNLDDRRMAVVFESKKVYEFAGMTPATVGKLYDIVVHEHENWDGEFVSVESLLTFMVARYNAVGLAPSRN